MYPGVTAGASARAVAAGTSLGEPLDAAPGVLEAALGVLGAASLPSSPKLGAEASANATG